MAPSKRKLEGQDDSAPSTMSAFAARKKLWNDHKDITTAPPPEVVTQSADSSGTIVPLQKLSSTQRVKSKGNAEETSGVQHTQVVTVSTTPVDPSHIIRAVTETTPLSTNQSQTSHLQRDTTRRQGNQHSTFTPTKQNYQPQPDGRILLKLNEGERLVILGSYGIQVTEGTVTVYGSTLSTAEETYWIDAPHCYALPIIRSADNSSIELSPASYARSIRLLERLNPVFTKLWSETSTRGQPSKKTAETSADTFQIIFGPEDGPKKALLQQLVSPAEWNKKLAELAALKQTKPAIIFICGPKSSGKSTFGKLLANRLLTNHVSSKKGAKSSVAILDIDPGQPEYSPPGMISLNQISSPNMSPSFCRHPSRGSTAGCQLRAHAIASVSPGHDPEHYLECVRDLFLYYQAKIGRKSPLVINTPGWVQGTGLDILVELIRFIVPTEVIYMSREGLEETVEALQSAYRGVRLERLPSQSSEFTSRTALHLRTMQTMSYFHADSGRDQDPVWYSSPLTEKLPWKVRYSGKNPGFVGVLYHDNQVAPSLLAEAINGTVMALVLVENKAAFRHLAVANRASQIQATEPSDAMDVDDDSQATDASLSLSGTLVVETPEGIPVILNSEGATLDPKHSRALGLVLVRGINAQAKEVELLAQIPDQSLLSSGSSFVLVAGKFDTPTWAYTEDLYNQDFDSAAGDVVTTRRVEVADEDTGSDSSEDEGDRDPGAPRGITEGPWVEKLYRDQKRSVGSRVWRVRRDLGKPKTV